MGSVGAKGLRKAQAENIQFYSEAPENVVNATHEARDWLTKEFGDDATKILPTAIEKGETYARDTTIAESRKNRILIYDEKSVDTPNMVHEYTHNLTNSIFSSPDTRKANAEFDKARREVYKNAGMRANKANDAKYVSKYGSTNSHEFFSEVVRQYYDGKRNVVINTGMEYLKGKLKK